MTAQDSLNSDDLTTERLDELEQIHSGWDRLKPPTTHAEILTLISAARRLKEVEEERDALADRVRELESTINDAYWMRTTLFPHCSAMGD